MSDEEKLKNNPSNRLNLNKFSNIVEKDTMKKNISNQKKLQTNMIPTKTADSKVVTMSKMIKPKVNESAEISYISGIDTEKNESNFIFDQEDVPLSSENVEEEFNNKRVKEVKKFDINKNVIEDHRKKKEQELATKLNDKKIKDYQENEIKEEKRKVNTLIARFDRIKNERQDSNLKIKKDENEIKTKVESAKRRLANHINPTDFNEDFKINSNVDPNMDLITNLKDKDFKDVTELLEESFNNHFSRKHEFQIETDRMTDLLDEIEKNQKDEDKKKIKFRFDSPRMISEKSLQSIKEEDRESKYNKYSENIEHGDIKSNINPMHLDEYNRFYKSDFYKNKLFKEKEEDNFLKISNKDSLLFKSRLILNYFNEKTNKSLPKFAMQSEKERKCQEILKVGDMKIEDRTHYYYDRYICLNLRKKYFRFGAHVSSFCHYIVNNSIFDNISLAVILINTFLILISDPTDTNSIANTSDNLFLYLYTIEMILKIFAYGFIIPEGAYLKDMWNFLDFFVIIVGWISIILEAILSGGKIAGLAGLRAFRILRPLKTVKSIKGLRSLIVTLLKSLIALSDTAIVVIFFFLIFSIAGVQMWQGLILRRCMSLNYGYFYDFSNYTTLCSLDDDCAAFNSPGNQFVCVKSFMNPNGDLTHFDNVVAGLTTVYIIASMEGWTDIWNYVSRTFKDQYGINMWIIFFYFHVLLFVGGYYLINLFLAVIKTQFTNISNNNKLSLTNKRNLYQLVQQKYLKYKNGIKKEEKKEKAINANDAIKKLKDQTVFIKRNIDDIPINYNTLKDITNLKILQPNEINDLKNKIAKEEIEIEKNFKKKEERIRKMAKIATIETKDIEAIQKSSDLHSSKTLTSTSDTVLPRQNTIKRRNSVNFRRASTTGDKTASLLTNQISIEIHQNYLPPSINETQKKFEFEITNLKKKKSNDELKTYENFKDKAMKYAMKQLKKKKKCEISMQEDISFDLHTNKNLHDTDPTQFEEELRKSEYNANMTSGSPKKKIKSFNTKISKLEKMKTNIQNIQDEISFFSDYTEDDIEDDNKFDLEFKNIGKENNFQIQSSPISNINKMGLKDFMSIPGLNHAINKILASKKTIIDTKDSVYNNVTFNRPTKMMTTIFRHKDEINWKKKFEEKRKRFDLKEYLSQEKLSDLKRLGKRHSFLNVLQHITQKTGYEEILNPKIKANEIINDENLNNSLEISLFKDEELLVDSKSFSDIDIVPTIINEDDKYIDDLDFETSNKQKEYYKMQRIARKSIFENNKRSSLALLSPQNNEIFLSKLNMKMNNNIVLDMKEPLRKGNQLKRAKSMKTDHISLIVDEKINKLNNTNTLLIFYKSRSIEKNINKIPSVSINNDRKISKISLDNNNNDLNDKKKLIPIHQQEKKRYFNYLYNILNKDFKIKDEFKADYWREDVLGTTVKEYEQIKKPEELNPTFVFNDSSLNLKSYSYQRYKKYERFDNEYITHNHKLKFLGENGISIFNPNCKNMLGSVTKSKKNDFSIRSLATTFAGNLKSKKASVAMNSSHRSSILGQSPVNSIYHGKFNDFFKFKKGQNDKVHKRLDNLNFKTFSHYFMQDQRFIGKINQNIEKREDLNILSHLNVQQEDHLEVRQQIEKIKIYDIETNSRKYIEWSGQQVLDLPDDPELFDNWNDIIDRLEEFDVILWKNNKCSRLLQKMRYVFYVLSVSQFVDFCIIGVVILNSIVMALDGNLLDPDTLSTVQVSNYVFNSIFIAEFMIKFIGLGPVIYFSDPFTYLDVFIIAFAILDMATDSNSSSAGPSANISSQLSFLRVFRIFRVLRLTKVLRKIKVMRRIFKGVAKSAANVSYIVLILMIFLLIFQLLGMSLINSSPMFQSFLDSFYVTFQVLTVENWNYVLYALSPISKYCVLYLVAWIFLGNYILFNLFISVLLDSFDDEGDEEELNEYHLKLQTLLPEIFKQYQLAEKEQSNRLKKFKDYKNKNQEEEIDNNKSVQNVDLYKSINQSQSHSTYSQREDMMSSMHSSANPSPREDEENHSDILRTDEDDDNAQTNSAKTIKIWERNNRLFKHYECEYSIYLFSQTNKFRIFMIKLAENKKFDNFILGMILVSTLRLIADTFISGYKSDLIFDMCDIVFTMIFIFEAFTKIIAFGFVMDPASYLTDNWNKIDFLIVTVSIVDLQGLISKYTGSLRGSSLNFLKVLRLLRLLRPLRFISHNVQLKLIITSLFDSIVPIMNVLFVVLVVFFMFSIVGMNLFYDIYHTCYKSVVPGRYEPILNFSDYQIQRNITKVNDTLMLCNELGGLMDAAPRFQFSNLFSSLITCYVLSNMEGWPDIMQSYISFNKFYGIFFIAFIFLVSYFCLNLFVGIMFNCFNKAWSKEKKKGITNNYSAEKYWDWLKQIEFAKPDFDSYKIPTSGYKLYLYRIASSKFLDNFIMAVIILNMILMAMNYEGSTDTYNGILDLINLAFTSVFIAECCIKLLAYGFKGYFYQSWNQFDFFVVASSIVDIIVSNSTGTNSAFLKSFQIIRVLRVLRVTRVLRLFKSMKGLEKLLQTLRWSMTALTNIFILMFLVFCIFAIMGCYVYEAIKYEDYKAKFVNFNEYFNFDNFYNSLLLCFRCVTGESWPDIMVELQNVDPNAVPGFAALLYMISMNFIMNVIMLNLFVLVTLQQYDEFVNKKENPIEKFNELLVAFKNAWNKYSTENDHGMKIKSINAHDFLMDLDWPYTSYKKKVEDIKIYILDLDLLKHKNYVYFNDFLFKFVKKEIGGRVDEKISIITKEENRLNKIIQTRIFKFIRAREKISGNSNPLIKFNPLTSHLYYKTSFTYLRSIINNYNFLKEKFIRQGYENLENDDNNSENSGSPILSENNLNSGNIISRKISNIQYIDSSKSINQNGSVSLNEKSKKENNKSLSLVNQVENIRIEANNNKNKNSMSVIINNHSDSNRSEEKLIIRENKGKVF